MTDDDFYNPNILSGHLVDSLLRDYDISLSNGIMNVSEFVRGINVDLLYQKEPITIEDIEFDRYADDNAKNGVIEALNKLREIQVYGSIQDNTKETSDTTDLTDDEYDRVSSVADDLKYADDI